MRVLLILVALVAIGAFIFLRPQNGGDQEQGEVPPAPTEMASDPAEDDEAPSTETVALPRFDLVRVDRSGRAVTSGQAAPGSTVEILSNGTVVQEIRTGADGNFAREIDTPLSEGAVELSLRMITADGMVVNGPDTIIIYVPEREGDSPVVLRTTPGGATEILQRASDPAPGLGPLSIETIDYDAGGNAIFSGRATPNSVVQIFAGRQAVGSTQADGQGRWTLSSTIPPGRYTLQILQLNEDGSPAYALEVPFEQAAPEDIVLRDGAVVVQPGNSLWVISRSVYGRGEQYTVIYEANESQIRDPDLIFPGQIFRLPEEDDTDDATAP